MKLKFSDSKRLRAIFLVLAIALFGAGAGLSANTFSDETLNYKIMFKWGLVNKQAGRATLSLRTSGSEYKTLLTARSENWADRFYRVRDTLIGRIHRETMRPLIYIKRSHEGKENKHDVVKYNYSGARVIGSCTRRKWDEKGNLVRNEERVLEAYGTTVDMLSSFYYMRNLPFEQWKPGHVVTLNIYSGKRKELLTIKYAGINNVSLNGRKERAYHIRFTFSSDGKKTSDDLDAWIQASPQRIPLKMEGKLKVGKVQALFTGTD